jgi:hypothetical protein
MIILKILALILVLIVWLVIGPFLWIPLLIRSFGFVTMNLMATVVTGASMAPAQASIDTALSLYGRGFVAAFTILGQNPTDVQSLPHQAGYARLLGELLYVILFWAGTVATVMWFMGVSPVEVVRSRMGFVGPTQVTADNSPTIVPVATMPPGPIGSRMARGFMIKLYRCSRDAKEIQCELTVENRAGEEATFSLGIGGPEGNTKARFGGATMADDRGNHYLSSAGTVGNHRTSDCAGSEEVCKVETVALHGVVIPVSVTFDNVDLAASVAKRLIVKFGSDSEEWSQPIEFHDIDFVE